MIATSGFLTALERTKFVFGRGCVPDPAEGAYSAPPDTLAGLRGPTSKGEGRGRRRKMGRGGDRRERRGTIALPPSQIPGSAPVNIVALCVLPHCLE